MSKPLRARLQEGPVLGAFSNIPHPAATEILGAAGYDAVCLDGEHGAYDLHRLAEGIRAAENSGAYSMVRVPGTGPLISQVLDAGAAAVMVPRVSSEQEARSAIAYARYPAVGRRGFGLGRSSRYSGTEESIAVLDQRTYVIIQIETLAGVESLDDICTVEGLDMVFVGPHDLSVSMGAPMGSPAHASLVESIITRAHGRGLATGIFCTTPEQVGEFAAMGVSLILLGADVLMLSAQARSLHQTARLSLQDTALQQI